MTFYLTQEQADDAIILGFDYVNAAIEREIEPMPEKVQLTPESPLEIRDGGRIYQISMKLPTKEELRAKIRDTLTKAAQAQAMPIHRDVLTYFTEALAEALYVAPPVDPGKIEGVG